MHAELSITAGHVLMATDMLRSKGQETRIGVTLDRYGIRWMVNHTRAP